MAIASPARNAQVADVPTVDEAGAPGLHMSLWYGFWAPRGTPDAVVNRLKDALQESLADPEVRTRLTGLGMEIPPRDKQTPQALLAQQQAEIERWWPVVKAANIRQQ